MTLKYLNLTGLNALVSAIKTWVLSRIPTKTSELTNDASFITANSASTTYAPISHNHDASEITSGIIDIARLPPAALERLTTVADQTARYALTTSTVQLGDTVKQLDTGIMYLVVDTTKLNSADGYVEYSAGTASKAIADEDGTSIKTGYGKLAGNQTWTGENSFSKAIKVNGARTAYILPESAASYSGMALLTYGFSGALKIGTYTLDANNNPSLDTSAGYINVSTGVLNSVNIARLEPKNATTSELGSSSYQWSSVYAQSYYYNGTEFSSKFVTTDMAQTITGIKTWGNQIANTAFTLSSKEDSSYIQINGGSGWQKGGAIVVSGKDRSSYTNSVLFAVNNSDNSGVEWVTIQGTSSGTQLKPSTNGTQDLGTSTNQWKSVYSQTYYYNGTAWGLDKVNEWTTTNRFLTAITLKNTELEIGVAPSTSYKSRTFYFTDNNNNDLATIIARTNSSGSSYLSLVAGNLYKNGVMDSTGSKATGGLYIGTTAEGKAFCSSKADLYPETNNTYTLGTSTNKWKTLNGINPGALSLPSFSSSNPTMLVWSDLDTTNWLLDGTGNDVSIALDGYVYVSVICGTDGYVVITEGQYGYPNCYYMATGLSIAGTASALLPVRKGIGICIYCKGTSIIHARFFPMQGNV